MMIFIGNGALVKGLYAALLVVCLVVIVLVKERSFTQMTSRAKLAPYNSECLTPYPPAR